MSEIQSLARGLKILDLLSRAPEGVTITELAETLGVDKGSASRLVATLARYGYAEKDEISRRYHLGPQVVSLSRSVLARLPLREAAKPYLRQLMETTGECAHLAVPAQGKALYIDQVESPATLRVNAAVGTMNPLHCTALGKVLLAFSDAPLPTTLETYTPHTITDPQTLRRHLEEVRRLGYAVDDGEFDSGVRCIAVPILDFRGKTVGSIGISGPATRVTLERLPELTAAVLEIGHALSERMAFSR
ncbi:MAG: IclR family transcriptional regulator [Anaerolineae bacterium]|jgi:DNA-binding IclR family transcriptional regulator|nr:IclR family transcriptional regulator [Anaerolineae bacterium]